MPLERCVGSCRVSSFVSNAWNSFSPELPREIHVLLVFARQIALPKGSQKKGGMKCLCQGAGARGDE